MDEDWRRSFLSRLDEYITNMTSDVQTQRSLNRRQELRLSLFHMLGDVSPQRVDDGGARCPDYSELEKRLRAMASAWKRWGTDGIFLGALHSDVVTEAANAIAKLTEECASMRRPDAEAMSSIYVDDEEA